MTKFAILDVDETIRLSSPNSRCGDVLNMALITGLFNQGIKDVVFYTNMNLSNIHSKKAASTARSYTRDALIKEFEHFDMKVHFVSTPGDYVFGTARAGDSYQHQFDKYFQTVDDVSQPGAYHWDLTRDSDTNYISQTISKSALLSDVEISLPVKVLGYEANSRRGTEKLHVFDSYEQYLKTCKKISTLTVPGESKLKMHKQHLEKEQYGLAPGLTIDDLQSFSTTLTAKAAGKGYESAKGVMAEAVIARLIDMTDADDTLELVVADDRKACLTDFIEAAKRMSVFTDRLITVQVCSVPRDTRQAMKVDYAGAVAQLHKNTQTKVKNKSVFERNIDTLSYSSKLLFLRGFSKQVLAESVINNLNNYAMTDSWRKLSAMALNGNGLFKGMMNPRDAITLLKIGMLRAKSDTELDSLSTQLECTLGTYWQQIITKPDSAVKVIKIKEPSDLSDDGKKLREQMKSPLQVTQEMTASHFYSYLKRQAMLPNNKTSLHHVILQRTIKIVKMELDFYTSLINAKKTSLDSQIAREIDRLEHNLSFLLANLNKKQENPLPWPAKQKMLELAIEHDKKTVAMSSSSSASSSSSHTGACSSKADLKGKMKVKQAVKKIEVSQLSDNNFFTSQAAKRKKEEVVETQVSLAV